MGARPPAPVCDKGTQGCGGLASTTCGLCYMSAMAEQPPPAPQRTSSGASASLINSAKSGYSTDNDSAKVVDTATDNGGSNPSRSSSSRSHGHMSRIEMERMLTEKLQLLWLQLYRIA